MLACGWNDILHAQRAGAFAGRPHALEGPTAPCAAAWTLQQGHLEARRAPVLHGPAQAASADRSHGAVCLAAVAFGFASSILAKRAQAQSKAMRPRRCVACYANDDAAATRAFIATESDPEPVAASDVNIAALIKWARQQNSMRVHPGVVARNGQLVISMAVDRGTPLIGAMPDAFLGEQPAVSNVLPDLDAECQSLCASMAKPELWPYRLATRLLREANDSASAWQPYVASLDPRPPAPLLWSPGQANELQYLPAKRALKDELLEFQSIYDANFSEKAVMGANVDRSKLASLVASVRSRGIELEPGRWVLVPLIDIVGPPEGASLRDPSQSASCELSIEGGENSLAFLTAARDLKPGDILTRSHNLSSDELLLRHGIAAAPGPSEDVAVWTSVGRGNIMPWQQRAISRVCETEPGPAPGSVVFKSNVRRAKSFKESIDGSLIYSTRALSCRREREFHGADEWAQNDVSDLSTLDRMGTEQRRDTIMLVANAIEGYKKTFDTTTQEDIEQLPLLTGNRRVAVAYRLEKKRVLEEVEAIVERRKDREVQKRAQKKQETGLPAAVTGKKTTKPQQRGFGGSVGEVFDEGGADRKDAAGQTDKKIGAGCRVELLRGKFKGEVGTVMRNPDSLDTVAIRLDSGKEIDKVRVEMCQQVTSWLDVQPQTVSFGQPEEEPEDHHSTLDAPTPSENERGPAQPSVVDSVTSLETEELASALDPVDLSKQSAVVKEAQTTEIAEESRPASLSDEDMPSVQAQPDQELNLDEEIAQPRDALKPTKEELTQRLFDMFKSDGGEGAALEAGLHALENCLQDLERERMLRAMREVGVAEGTIEEVIQKVDELA